MSTEEVQAGYIFYEFSKRLDIIIFSQIADKSFRY